MSAVTNAAAVWMAGAAGKGLSGLQEAAEPLTPRRPGGTGRQRAAAARQLCAGAERSLHPTPYVEHKMSAPSASCCTDENAVLQSTEL